jgi:DNA-binding transcriptional ArsR family regulator
MGEFDLRASRSNELPVNVAGLPSVQMLAISGIGIIACDRCHRSILLDPMMTTMANAETAVAAALFRSLGDETRLSILLALEEAEHRVTDLVDRLGCSQANVSQHLACLRDCDLVTARPEGRSTWYALAHPMSDLLGSAEALLAQTGHAVSLCRTYGPDRRA